MRVRTQGAGSFHGACLGRQQQECQRGPQRIAGGWHGPEA